MIYSYRVASQFPTVDPAEDNGVITNPGSNDGSGSLSDSYNDYYYHHDNNQADGSGSAEDGSGSEEMSTPVPTMTTLPSTTCKLSIIHSLIPCLIISNQFNVSM